MVRRKILAIVISTASFGALPSVSSAQSLDQSFTALCSGADRTSETCQALAKAIAERNLANSNPAKQKVSQRWGILATLVGSVWKGPDGYWQFVWDQPDQQMRVRHFNSDGKESKGMRTIIESNNQGGLTLNQATRISPVTLLADGNIFDDTFDEAFISEGPNAFLLQRGTYKQGVYKAATKQRVERNGTYHRLGPADEARFNAVVQARQQSGEGGGLGRLLQGALAGAAGMANGGGGYDAAIAGAAAGAVAGAAGVDAAAIQGGFQQGASEVNAQNDAMQAQFEQSMARAGAPGYGSSGSAVPNSQAGSSQRNTSGTASTARQPAGAKVRKSFRFHLIVGLENRPEDTANALCMSNAISESFESAENGWGDTDARDRIFETYRPNFEAKCSRLRPLDGTTTYAYDQGWNSSSIGVAPNNMYFRVTLP